ncbi:DUF982 domain-containing protein [Streptomyces nigra]|uniref:DUF982 domain-containing protein n=1 Tax=Streptomyces nigra TaxID=1827580 RepID=UPI0036AFBC66
MSYPDMSWSPPVLLRVQRDTELVFDGPLEAINFLENEWPSDRGHEYDRAVVLCIASLDDCVPLVAAREAFVAACIEAGMSQSDGTSERTSGTMDD